MNRDELLETCFGRSDFPSGRLRLETTNDADVLSHLDLYYRRVLVFPRVPVGAGTFEASRTLLVAALGQVCTDPGRRGEGLATDLVRLAHVEAASHSDVAFAAVFAGEPTRGFFERLGYRHPAGAASDDFLVFQFERNVLTRRDPETGEDVWETVVGEWPAGRVDTRGEW